MVNYSCARSLVIVELIGAQLRLLTGFGLNFIGNIGQLSIFLFRKVVLMESTKVVTAISSSIDKPSEQGVIYSECIN